MTDPRKRVRLGERVQKGIRFPRDMVRQIDNARKYCGQTFQAFVQAAVMKAVADAKAEEEQARLRRAQRRQPKVHSAPVGLGIQARLAHLNDPIDGSDGAREERIAPPPVVVNVETRPAALGHPGTGDLKTLARMVVEGPRSERRRLLQSACESLKRQARTPAESIQLAEQLDTEIKLLEVPPTALERVRARRKK